MYENETKAEIKKKKIRKRLRNICLGATGEM